MTESGEGKSSKITSILSISHEKDVDGVGAAAIVWRYAKSKGLDFNVDLADYGSFERVFTVVASQRDTLIIITDLGMDENHLALVIAGLEKAIGHGCRLVWLDHHQWSKRSIKAIQSLGNKPILRVNHDFCAAEIAFKVLMPRDEICAEIALVAHDTDFNLRELDSANALADALSVIRFHAITHKLDMTDALIPLLTSLAKGGVAEVWDGESKRFKDRLLDDQVRNYRKERMKKMKRALKNHCDQMIHGRLVRVVQIPTGVTTTDLGTFVADEENLVVDGQRMPVADLFLALSPGGMLGFRRGTERVLCDQAARLFNGGGHPYAAGGSYGDYEDFQAACDDIFHSLTENREWVTE